MQWSHNGGFQQYRGIQHQRVQERSALREVQCQTESRSRPRFKALSLTLQRHLMNKNLRTNCDKANKILRRGLNKEPKFTRRAAFYKLARAREFCRNLEILRFKPGTSNKRCQTEEETHQPHSQVQCVGNVFSINTESRGEEDTLCGLPHLFSPDLLVE